MIYCVFPLPQLRITFDFVWVPPGVVVDLDDCVGVYDAKRHPDVQVEFLSNVVDGDGNGVVTR